jgi:hypothetical protein
VVEAGRDTNYVLRGMLPVSIGRYHTHATGKPAERFVEARLERGTFAQINGMTYQMDPRLCGRPQEDGLALGAAAIVYQNDAGHAALRQRLGQQGQCSGGPKGRDDGNDTGH